MSVKLKSGLTPKPAELKQKLPQKVLFLSVHSDIYFGVNYMVNNNNNYCNNNNQTKNDDDDDDDDDEGIQVLTDVNLLVKLGVSFSAACVFSTVL